VLEIQFKIRTCFKFVGVLGIKVKIMLPHDPKGVMGPREPLPDHVHIVEPKDEQVLLS